MNERSLVRNESRTQRYDYDTSILGRWNNLIHSNSNGGDRRAKLPFRADTLVFIDTRQESRSVTPKIAFEESRGYIKANRGKTMTAR